ncbi:MAG: hypothetical protein PVJ39_06470 [Gammaproteobacteria bacterium]
MEILSRPIFAYFDFPVVVSEHDNRLGHRLLRPPFKRTGAVTPLRRPQKSSPP